MKIINKIKNRLRLIYTYKIYFPLFHRVYLPFIIKKIRKKEKIRFLFVLQILSQWKTEQLYLAMLKHPRFEPIIGIIPCISFPGEELNVIKYCKNKGYDYIKLDPHKTLIQQVNPDIVTHQQPYTGEIYPQHYVTKNLKVPCVVIPYGMNSILEKWMICLPLYRYCWKQYFENDSCCEERRPIHDLKGLNYEVTGLPFMDELNIPKEHFLSPWPNNNLKRIIYAPHHTISNLHAKGLAFSTFLENGEFMLEMMKKYKHNVYFVFKPHPTLYKKLCTVWGKEKTDEYYAKWANSENSKIELGEYLGLFKYSDAMIHDCCSFTVEYMYTHKPVMYLINNEHHADNLNDYMVEAFNLHYKGRTHKDIENFIVNVINGIDPMKEERLKYYKEKLLPPYGKSACENIINSILGIEEYA